MRTVQVPSIQVKCPRCGRVFNVPSLTTEGKALCPECMEWFTPGDVATAKDRTSLATMSAPAPALPPYHIIVDFGGGFSSELQGSILLDLERWLRETGLPVEVFKREMPDDSKLRRNMTEEERKRL